jgi:hypothetical protein
MEKEVVCCCTSTINVPGYVIYNAGCKVHGLRVKSIQPVDEFTEEIIAKQKSK